MRGSTHTMKHTHMHVPSMQDAKDWAEKNFTKENTADIALSLMAIALCGWLVYSLANAFERSTYLM